MLIKMDATTVGARLGLDPSCRDWLDQLEVLGPPMQGVPLPSGAAATHALRQVGVEEQDLGAIVGALPSAAHEPELWWLLERSYHGVLLDIGRWDAPPRWCLSLPSSLGTVGRCFWIYVFLAALPAIRSWHQTRGIPDAISSDTLADLGRHIRLYRLRQGCTGFDTQHWIGLHFRAELFALGRLQFNAYRLRTGIAGPLFWYGEAAIDKLGPGFRPGDAALGVHIPDAGPMTPEACAASFQAAKPFFARYFPDHDPRIATCTSWLMDDQLLEYLEPTSNVVRFQQRFELVPGARDDDEQTLRFVFRRVPRDLAEVVPSTRLEHAIVDHLRAGRHWRLRTGWLTL